MYIKQTQFFLSELMMSKFNAGGLTLSLIMFLLSSSVISEKSGSPVRVQSSNRPDPLRKFKPYHGGYDLRSKHYWASAAFTGIHGYAIAGGWMLLGLGFGSYLILKKFYGSVPPIVDHPNSHYRYLFSIVVLFILLAIVASSVTIAANQRYLHRTKRLIETILGAGSDTRETMTRVVMALKKMQNLLDSYEQNISGVLGRTAHRIRVKSTSVQDFLKESRRISENAIETSYIANLVFVTINLVSLTAGCVLLFLHWRPGFIIIILLCWIWITISWILTGFDFFFHNFAGDTCTAFDDFEQNPQNSSLGLILSSCVQTSSSNRILARVGRTIHNIITKLNSEIPMLRQLLRVVEPGDDLLLGSQQICDPFSGAPNYTFTPENCPKGAIQIGDLPNILSRYTCYSQNSTKDCIADRRFLPEASYIKAAAYSESIQELIDLFPDMQSLSQCTSVKNAFSDVVLHQCKPFIACIKMLWCSMLALSIVMVILTLLWIMKAYQEKGRCFSKWSITPKPF